MRNLLKSRGHLLCSLTYVRRALLPSLASTINQAFLSLGFDRISGGLNSQLPWSAGDNTNDSQEATASLKIRGLTQLTLVKRGHILPNRKSFSRVLTVSID